MTSVGQTSTNGVLFQVPDIGVRRRNAQRHVSVVGQFHLFQHDSVAFLLSLIGVSTQVSFVCCREGCVGVYVIDINQLVAFVIRNRTGTSSVVDANFIVTGSRYNVVNRAVIQFVAVVDIAITVDGQVTVRVHCDSTVTIVSLSGIPGTVVHQVSVQNIIAAMDIEHTRNNITVVISSIAAGQFQFISAEYFGIKLTNIHIQHTTVSYGDGISIQV
ncbi:Uncharacterised protein [Salmonella enterica subsp. enterica serovar Typhimurium str. DT104]|nr:Uncharacterised protein [Salmonella enterica subsp. enterica serovar Typhimurium str. DT104]